MKSIQDACYDCLTLNGSGWALAYGAIVLFFAFAKTSQYADEATKSENAWASLLSANPGALSIHGTIVQQMAIFLTPKNYVLLLARFYRIFRRLIGIDRRSIPRNIIVFFIFYYLLVSAPAAVMRPINFQVSYDGLSLFALAMMMLTNAVGDLISLRLTFRNIEKLKAGYTESKSDSSVWTSYWAEAKLYFTTMIDAIMALIVLFAVLLLTSIFFGWSNPFWQAPDWIFCRDDRWRPVESGTCPLADGISARVGRLRSYGNAITPPLAAQFIRAFNAALSDSKQNHS